MTIIRPRLAFLTASVLVWDLIGAAALTVVGLLVVRADWGQPFALAGSVLATGSVAVRRRYPVLAVAAAVGGTVVLERAAGNVDLTTEAVALALCFFLLGSRSAQTRRWSAAVGLLGCWLAGAVIVGRSTGSGSPAAVAATWMTTALVPLGFAAAVNRHRTRSLLLEQLAAELAAEEELRALLAAEEERCRIARDLHDVVAHGVSVMVIQAAAATRILARDLAAALVALEAVAESGREALRDLRRVVGVVRHETLADGEPRLSELPALIERARHAGVAACLSLPGGLQLPLALEATVYRIIQEALTNTITHSRTDSVTVTIRLIGSDLEVSIVDDGVDARPRSASVGGEHGSGRGLAGMRERIAAQGGSLTAGAQQGGFAVRASLPVTPDSRQESAGGGRPAAARAALRLLHRWTDPAIAALALLAMEAEAFLSDHRTGPLALNAVVVALMATAALRRRGHPIAFLIVVDGLSVLLAGGLTSLGHATITGSYALVLPLWTVATCTSRRTATSTLILFAAGAAAIMAVSDPHQIGGLLGALIAGSVVWGAGRLLRAHRRTTVELQRRAQRLQQRRQQRMRTAAATESARLARELQTGVAHALAVIVVETEAAQLLIATGDPTGAGAIGQIEEAARRALAEMRTTLGVLRRGVRDDEDDVHTRRIPGSLRSRLESSAAPGRPPAPVAAAR